MGLVVLLFVVYEVYVTDLLSAEKQDEATAALDSEWNANVVPPPPADPNRQTKLNPLDGQAFAKIYIPAFGADYKFTVVEGTTDKHLAVGPGHYKDTAQPGQPGNFAVAGHRTPRAPRSTTWTCSSPATRSSWRPRASGTSTASCRMSGEAAGGRRTRGRRGRVEPAWRRSPTTLGDSTARPSAGDRLPDPGRGIAPVPRQVTPPSQPNRRQSCSP